MVDLVEFFCGLVALCISEDRWLIQVDGDALKSFSCYPKVYITDHSIKLVLDCWYDNCLFSMPWRIVFSSKHSTLYPDVINISHDCKQKTISLKYKHKAFYSTIASISSDIVNHAFSKKDAVKFTDFLFDIAAKKYEEINGDEGYRNIVNGVL